jgi:hypothetical protein
MKQMNIINRSGLYLNAAMLALSVSLVSATPAPRLPVANHGKTIHPALKSSSAHVVANYPLKADWWSWLRRPPF